MNRFSNIQIALGASVVLHAVTLMTVGVGLDLGWWDRADVQEIDKAPLVFDLEQPEKPREVVETPETAEAEPPEEADLLSDKNTRWRNPETDPSLPVDRAFARGDQEVYDYRQTLDEPSGDVRVNAGQDPLEPAPTESWASRSAAEEFHRDLLVTPPKRRGRNQPRREESTRVRYDNQASRALDLGAFSLNTYAWEWAPYLLRLKRKVEPNIYPPPAFYRLGLISGQTVLRFKIMPTGDMRDLTLIDYQGHETLMQTSMRAIEISVPFEPLPEDFPKPYLEITARFNYFIQE